MYSHPVIKLHFSVLSVSEIKSGGWPRTGCNDVTVNECNNDSIYVHHTLCTITEQHCTFPHTHIHACTTQYYTENNNNANLMLLLLDRCYQHHGVSVSL